MCKLHYQGMDIDYFNDFTDNYNLKKAQNFGKPGLNLSTIRYVATIAVSFFAVDGGGAAISLCVAV